MQEQFPLAQDFRVVQLVGLGCINLGLAKQVVACHFVLLERTYSLPMLQNALFATQECFKLNLLKLFARCAQQENFNQDLERQRAIHVKVEVSKQEWDS